MRAVLALAINANPFAPSRDAMLAIAKIIEPGPDVSMK
jgi:hypothetical protein